MCKLFSHISFKGESDGYAMQGSQQSWGSIGYELRCFKMRISDLALPCRSWISNTNSKKHHCPSHLRKVIDFQYQELLQNFAENKLEHTLAKTYNKELLKHTLESSELYTELQFKVKDFYALCTFLYLLRVIQYHTWCDFKLVK